MLYCEYYLRYACELGDICVYVSRERLCVFMYFQCVLESAYRSGSVDPPNF